MWKRRSIGVGVTNFAYWMVKNGLSYDNPDSLNKIDELFEHIQFNLIKASMELAKEEGPCEWFNRTKYSEGRLPVDHYNKNVDKLVDRELSLDWDGLRKDVVEHGMRNSTLTAQMPCESSSVVMSATNGMESPRKLITVKKSKSGAPLPVVVPEILKYKNKYQFAWDYDNTAMNNVASVIQKYFDQGISVNHYYDKRKYDDGNLPISEVAKDILNFYKFGGKQIYYSNSKDYKSDKLDEMISSSEHKDLLMSLPEDMNDCDSGACAI
jgi:ribonucleoside-diphosphate reductase alpha chain